MKKNLIIVVLIAAVVFLFGAYQTANKDRKILAEENNKLVSTIDDVYEYGQRLYNQVSNGSEAKKIIPNSISFCNKAMTECEHVDVNGNLWITESNF